jgi:hypothetical protein
MKEAEQSRDYNERVSAVWRLSRSAAMYKGALQVIHSAVIAAAAAAVAAAAMVVVVVVLVVLLILMKVVSAPACVMPRNVAAGCQHACHEWLRRHGAMVPPASHVASSTLNPPFHNSKPPFF